MNMLDVPLSDSIRQHLVSSGRGTQVIPSVLPRETCPFTSDWQPLSYWRREGSRLVATETRNWLKGCRFIFKPLLLPGESVASSFSAGS